MLDNEPDNETTAGETDQPTATSAPATTDGAGTDETKPLRARRAKGAAKAPAKRAPRKAKAAAPQTADAPPANSPFAEAPTAEDDPAPTSDATPAEEPTAPVKAVRKRAPRKSAAKSAAASSTDTAAEAEIQAPEASPFADPEPQVPTMVAPVPLSALFVAPADVPATKPARTPRAAKLTAQPEPELVQEKETSTAQEASPEQDDAEGDDSSPRRRRGRRGRGKARTNDDTEQPTESKPESNAESNSESKSDAAATEDSTPDPAADDAEDEAGGTRRRRRRRRRGEDGDEQTQTPTPSTRSSSNNTRESQRESNRDTGGESNRVRSVSGSVRLEAKRQRRKEGREAGRRRAPILTEAEFLARREAVDRAMVVRQVGERTQIAVLEDNVLVEHYVTRASAQSFAGGIYLGRIQNVLPSMEAAFVDIGKKRNAVLYAGEVNWGEAGLEGKQRNIEQALKSGDKVLVQVTKDPIGHKGARLTSQISLPGRYLVYVPGGSMTGISRKLPDVERQRLKDILRKIIPEDAGVIIRTAAEGASEEELTLDVRRLTAQWEVIQKKVADPGSAAPSVLYEEPDLAIRVVRDLFNEDFASMTVAGDDAWDTISAYVDHVAPDLRDRLTHYTGDKDVFAENRIDEQLLKALDRKVYLPSGGSLVIDNTEAMTVIDVNTGKFTGSGGNLEQTVTRNNLEAAEEIVRQLRLRDVGGIVVIDFIDMVLESNRELVLRRLTECLGRDRTKHQVAEVTSLGLVQMTRKRVGQGLLDAFSEPCEHCNGRGVIVHAEPVDRPGNSDRNEPVREERSTNRSSSSGGDRPKGRRERGGNRGKDETQNEKPQEVRRESKASEIMAASHSKSSDHAESNSNGRSDASVESQASTETVSQSSEHSAATGHSDSSVSLQPTETVSNGAKSDSESATANSDQTELPVTSASETGTVGTTVAAPPRRRRAARRPAGPPTAVPVVVASE